jgi:hypothetical protein
LLPGVGRIDSRAADSLACWLGALHPRPMLELMVYSIVLLVGLSSAQKE